MMYSRSRTTIRHRVEVSIMFQLRQILFPVDFSSRCRGAAAYVQALAGRFDAELILLHVVEATYNSTLADLHASRMGQIATFFDKSFRHLRVKTLVAHGEAAQKIVECASVNHADLIMIPTQGMGIYRRLILGSTSAKVLHDADCPVWTGVHLENSPPLEAVACQRILCALEHLKQSACCPVNLRVETGDVSTVVAHLAAELKADLLVIGRKPAAGVLGRLEMIAYSIIRQSPCPVVSV